MLTTTEAPESMTVQSTPPGGLIAELRAFVIDNFLFGQNDDCLTSDTSFLQAGIIDSTGLLELIGFVERTYDVRLTDDELVPENLDSLNRLAAFLSRKLSGPTTRLA
jgi:acyl carrier protein